MSVEVQDSLVAEAEFHWALAVHDEKNHNGASFVVRAGTEDRSYDGILPGSLKFSEDAAVSYVVRSGKKFVRVIHIPQAGLGLDQAVGFEEEARDLLLSV
jgi:hypothetical protein